MPRLTQLMVRCALIWLAAGYTVGGLLLAEKGAGLLPWAWALRLSHVHMLLAGWMFQLAFGVAFWILPRLDAAGSRGDERPVYVAWVALNGGALLGALHGPLAAAGLPLASWLPPAAGLAYAVAALAFASHAWRRALPFRTLARPER